MESAVGSPELPIGSMGGVSGITQLDNVMMVYAQEILSIPWGLLIGSFLIYIIL